MAATATAIRTRIIDSVLPWHRRKTNTIFYLRKAIKSEDQGEAEKYRGIACKRIAIPDRFKKLEPVISFMSGSVEKKLARYEKIAQRQEDMLEIREGKAFFRKLEKFENMLVREQLVMTSLVPIFHADEMAGEISQECGDPSIEEMGKRLNKLQALIASRAERRIAQAIKLGAVAVLLGAIGMVAKHGFALPGMIVGGSGLAAFCGSLAVGAFEWRPKNAERYMKLIESAKKRAQEEEKAPK